MFENYSGSRLHRDPASNKCKMLALGRWKGTLEQEDIPLPYLKLTDHLDYLGVRLFANYSATRRENGEILKKKVKDRVGSWKAGKFMALTSRPWSINSYCLPKLWYRTGCLDLRVGDSAAITSSVKSWLFQDMLLKPEEMMTYRKVEIGGLGVHNVKMRAMAMLIHTFLAQAITPRFPNNQYLNSLYRWHVLGDRSLPDPGRPPYYSTNFFNLIMHVKENTPLNVAWVTVKQWYELLLEMGVTHTSEDDEAPPVLISSKLEERHPATDFSTPYRISRIFGLSPEQKTFHFKMLQSLLPTRERLHRIGKIQSSSCLYCNDIPDTTAHLLSCTLSSQVSTSLVNCLRNYQPAITFEEITLLKIPVSESLELPLSWLTSTCLSYIWEKRVQGKQAMLDECRASSTS